jgi:site-specific recombinase XerD
VAKGGRPGVQRLTDKSVCDLVKAYAARLGLKAADFGAHSLRAGFLTSAARRGASVFKMRDVRSLKSCQATIGKWCSFSIPRKRMA